MGIDRIRLVTKMFNYSNDLSHHLDTAETQIRGLLILKDRPLIVEGLRDLIASFTRIESGAAAAVAEADGVIRELENHQDNGENGL